MKIKLDIPQSLYNLIKQYCDFNQIKDIDKEIIKFIQMGFNVQRYGTAPFKKAEEPQINVESQETEVLKPIDIIQPQIEEQVIEKPKRTRKPVRIIKT